MFRSLSVRDFRIWFIGTFISSVGTWMQATAQNWIVLSELTDNDANALGITAALQFAPPVLLAPLAGLLADRVDRRKLLMTTQVVMFALGFVLGTLLLLGVAELWHVYVLAGMLGVTTAIETPTRLTFVADLVDRANASNAVALNAAAFNLGRLVGPAVGGLLIVAMGSAIVFYVNCATFVVMFVLLLLIHPRPSLRQHVVPQGAAVRGGGFGYIGTRPDIVLVLVIVFIVGTFGLNFQIFTSTMAMDFELGADGFGLLTAVFSIGSLAGALHAASRPRARVRIIVMGLGIFGAMLLLSGFAPDAFLYSATLILLGYSVSTTFITANGYVQTTAAPWVRGRVMAIYSATFAGGAPLGSLVLGYTIDALGPRGGIFVAAAVAMLTLVGTVAWLIATGRFRRGQGRASVVLDITMPIAIVTTTPEESVDNDDEDDSDGPRRSDTSG